MKIQPYGKYKIVSIAKDGKKHEWNLNITRDKNAWTLANSEVSIGDTIKGFLIIEVYEISEPPAATEDSEQRGNIDAGRKIVNSKNWLKNLELESRNRTYNRKDAADPWFTNISGVYKIKNVDNGNYYLGRSTNVSYRWRSHINDLRENVHHNRLLQEDWWWNSGGYFLTFELIESCEMDINYLIEREQSYLDDHFGDLYCYNLSPYAYGEPGYIEKNKRNRWKKRP
jgi:hypothetical protein